MQPGHSNSIDTAHDLLRGRHGPLDVFVRPNCVALLGATDRMGSVGRRLAENLLKSAPRREVVFINPTRPTVMGRPCYPRLADVPQQVDLAIVAVSAARVPGVIEECLAANVRGAIVVSAGFKEIGAAGVALESQIRKLIAATRLRVIGPNCLGVMSPTSGLNASFAAAMARQGNLGFITQSGALLTAILDWSLAEKVGFSHVFSVGSMLDVGWGDLIDFLGDDPHTGSILLYMESIGNAHAFLSAAREVALQKPIIVIKAGRTETAAKAAASHTGALAGSDEVLSAAFRRVGVVQVRRMAELFNLAEALAKQPRPKGPHLAIVTNAGGPGVLAIDALVESGGQLAILSPETLTSLNQHLPPHWSHANPVDVLGDATPECYAKCLRIAAEAPECNGILALLAPQAMTDPTDTALRLSEHPHFGDKPILANWMGGSQVSVGIGILNNAGIPTFAYPDAAARTFQYMWQYSYALKALYETPVLNHADENPSALRSCQRFNANGAANRPHAVNRTGIKAGNEVLWHSDGGNGCRTERRGSGAMRAEDWLPRGRETAVDDDHAQNRCRWSQAESPIR